MSQEVSASGATNPASEMSLSGRVLILVTVFLGWMLAGVVMVIGPLALRAAPISFFEESHQQETIAELTDQLGGQWDALTIAEMVQQVEAKLREKPTDEQREQLAISVGKNLPEANRTWREQLVGGAELEVSTLLGPDIDAEKIVAAIKQRGDALRSREGLVGRWFAAFTCAFLLGAAAGGLIFGGLGDRIGRVRAMGVSILWYSLWTGITYSVGGPYQLLVLRFLACMGVGGMWPNGVALVSEAWSNVSRPLLAGLIGTSANLGFMLLALISLWVRDITPDDWRWVMWVGATPAALGFFVLLAVPESPRWLAGERKRTPGAKSSIREVFRPPLLKLTILGICLGAIPLMGNWGGANWSVPWSGQLGGVIDPGLKAATQWTKSFGGALGALIGGWVASQLGRRTTYFLISAISLAISYSMFTFTEPGQASFGWFVFGIGFFGTLYFGWLPLFLPELFPTSVRATGAGVSFNFGRIVTAAGVLFTGLLLQKFAGDYGRVGQWTCLVYLLGMIVIWFAPDTSQQQLIDD